MPLDYHRVSRGLEIDESARILDGAFTPRTTTDTDDAQQGSLFMRTDTGDQYTKQLAGTGTNKWEILATQAFVSSADDQVKVSVTDTTPGYLTDKLVFTSNFTSTTLNPAANEQLSVDLSNTGVIADDYNYVIVDAKGRVTSAFLRTLVQPLAGLTISNADFSTGNPTFALANDLAALEALSTTGFSTRVGVDSWELRTFVGTSDQIDIVDGDGIGGDPTFSIADNPILPGLESVTLPTGTTAQRPGIPVQGMLRFNTDIDKIEGYEGTGWEDYWTHSMAVDMDEPTGIVDRTLSDISFDDGTRTFTIQPTGVSFTYYYKGRLVTVTGALTFIIPDVSGIHTFAFDSTGVIVSSSTFDLENTVPISYVYWNATLNSSLSGVTEERHGCTMDWATHSYLHNTRGTVWAGGLDAGDYTLVGTGALDSDAELSISDGTIYDEDIRIDIENAAVPTNNFEQILDPIAEIPVIWRDGLGGDWRLDVATTFPVKIGASRIQWNQESLGTWSAIDASEGYFVAMWVVATNSLSQPIIVALGQREDSTLEDARNNSTLESFQIENLAFKEFKLLYRLIFETSAGFANTPRAALRDVLDLRGVTIVQVGVETQDHGTLTGLFDDDHPQYVHISIPRTITAQHTFDPVAPGAPFILGANATGQLITGLNADLLDGLDSTAFQPIDADLTALAAIATTGLYVITGAGTSTTRTITGTTNRISVTFGSGVLGDPTIDIDAAYIGQTSITTLGTIISGTWNANTIGTIYGGTGLTSYAQGDILYASAANTLTQLAKDTNATRYLSNTGTSNNPAWAQVNLADGVTGTLGATNGGTGQSTVATGDLLYGSAVNTWSKLTIGTANQILGVNTGGTNVEYKTLTAGTGITITPAAGSITIATNSGVLQLYRENPSSPTTPVASGTNAIALGTNSEATATEAIAFGNGALAALYGARSFANGTFAADGDAQTTICVLRRTTTNTASTTELFLDGDTATQRMVLPNDTAWGFRILVTARRTDADDEGAVYEFVGGIDRNATAGSTAIIGSVSKTVVAENTASWDANVNADTTNGSLRIQVNGTGTSTIRWVARVELTQVTG